MTNDNVLRCLVFLEDKCKIILLACKSRSWNLADLLVEHDFDSMWKFYKEVIPSLEKFAAQKQNDQIISHVKMFSNYIPVMDKYLAGKIQFHFLDWFPTVSYRNTDKFARDIQDISNNIGNLIYQIRISQ